VSVYVFAGPTISAEEGRSVLDAVFLPPVSQGDVYRVARKRPAAVGIVDGFFERVPAVWHKEILWAMKQGIHVYGSASMGALRAAELEAFGMEGVGVIFEAFRDGVLEDDDEVAVVHGPAETGYRPQSEAMVNIRPTLASAATSGAISTAAQVELERVAKGLFYPDRFYPVILRRAAEAGNVPTAELDALREWLLQGRVDQKRDDALAMLAAMRERLLAGSSPKRVRYAFEHTDMWEQARASGGELAVDAEPGTESILVEDLLDELRIQGDGYVRRFHETLARLLAFDEAERQRLPVAAEMVGQATDAFRRERGLLTGEDVEQWCRVNHLTWDRFTRLMEDEARLRWVQQLVHVEVTTLLPDHLRVVGDYARLADRARRKRRLLESNGLLNPALADVAMTEPQLMRWYFEEYLGEPVPPEVGLYARSVGFADEDAFRRAVLREFHFATRTGGSVPRSGGDPREDPPGASATREDAPDRGTATSARGFVGGAG
jgi:hypothetical protein